MGVDLGCESADGRSGDLGRDWLQQPDGRNIVFTSVSGNLVRVRFTNTFGDQPLQIAAASIAVAGTGAATAGPNVPLTFGGQSSVQIPIGAEAGLKSVSLIASPLQLNRHDVLATVPQR